MGFQLCNAHNNAQAMQVLKGSTLSVDDGDSESRPIRDLSKPADEAVIGLTNLLTFGNKDKSPQPFWDVPFR